VKTKTEIQENNKLYRGFTYCNPEILLQKSWKMNFNMSQNLFCQCGWCPDV